MADPGQIARQNIDKQFEAWGWLVQSRRHLNLYAARGVAVHGFLLETGDADCLLFVDRECRSGGGD